MIWLTILAINEDTFLLAYQRRQELLSVGVRASVSMGRWHPLVAGRGGTEVAILACVINCKVGRGANNLCPPLWKVAMIPVVEIVGAPLCFVTLCGAWVKGTE